VLFHGTEAFFCSATKQEMHQNFKYFLPKTNISRNIKSLTSSRTLLHGTMGVRNTPSHTVIGRSIGGNVSYPRELSFHMLLRWNRVLRQTRLPMISLSQWLFEQTDASYCLSHTLAKVLQHFKQIEVFSAIKLACVTKTRIWMAQDMFVLIMIQEYKLFDVKKLAFVTRFYMFNLLNAVLFLSWDIKIAIKVLNFGLTYHISIRISYKCF